MRNDDIHALLTAFRPGCRFRICDEHRGFSGAVVFQVEDDQGGLFALRQWANPSLNLRRLRGLHRLLRWIDDFGVKLTPVPVTANEGYTWLRHGGRIWQLEPWMPGTADFREHSTPQRLRNTMTALADWHRAARTFPATAEDAEWFRCESSAPSPAVTERLQKLLRWRDERFEQLADVQARDADSSSPFTVVAGRIIQGFRRHADSIVTALQALAETPVPLQPCLRDIWHDHVLFTGDKVTGVIDPTACRTESIAADLARLLGSLIADEREQWQFALDCFADQRSLSETEWRLVRVLDCSGVLLSGLTWLDREYLLHNDVASDPRVIDRLKRIADRLDNMSA